MVNNGHTNHFGFAICCCCFGISDEVKRPSLADSVNRVPIKHQKSNKMAQAIFEVLEGRNNLLKTVQLQPQEKRNARFEQLQQTTNIYIL